MSFDFSRRALITSATMGIAATAVPTPIFGQSRNDEPAFGPAPGTALLARNENPYGPAPSAMKAIADTAKMGCYYANSGVQKLAAMIAERHGLTPDHVLIGSGSTEVLSAIALIYGAKGQIVTPDLFWDTTVVYAERKGAKVVRVPLKADMSVDLDGIAAAVTPGTAMVQICNPNNPTGMVFDGATMRKFVKTVGARTTVLIDEAYNELTNNPDDASVIDLVKAGENVIVARTFSKIYGMAGLRVGYALGNPEVIKQAQGYLMSFGGNTAGLAAAIASYNDTAFTSFSKAHIVEAREMIFDAVKTAGLTALPSQTNFVYVKVPDADALRKSMADKGVLIRGSYGKWKQWSRVSTGKIEDVKRYASVLPSAVMA